MKSIILALTSLLSFSGFSQLSGIYTVGGVTPDFNSLSEACTAIETQGLTGPVTINVRDGIYTDSIHLTTITCTPVAHAITFQSESMNAANVEISNVNGLTAPVYLNGPTVDNITIQHLTFSNDVRNVVNVMNGVDNLTLSNCILNGFVGIWVGDLYGVIRIKNGAYNNDDITISNNIINNGSFGIWFENNGTYTGDLSITNNVLNNNYYDAMKIKYFGDLYLAENLISSTSVVNINAEAIKLTNGFGNTIIEQNEIYRTTQPSGAGFYIDQIAGTLLIHNNIVSLPSVNSGALYITNLEVEGMAIQNNTFRVGSNVISGHLESDCEIFNNILISTNGGRIFDLPEDDITVPPTTNNNAFYTTGEFAYLGWPYLVTYTTLNDYQIGTGQSANSFELIDFQFVDDVLDLHTCSDSLIGTGMYLPSVLVDIDGEPRSVSIPSIGADFFNNNGSLWNNGNLETCMGVPITLDAGTANNYLWSTTETTQSISASNFGEYTVEWTNNCGTYYDTVTINDITPVASFTNEQAFLTFLFTNTSQNGTSYLWDFGDGTTSTETNPIHVYSTLNTYTVTLTVTNSCGSDFTTFQVTPSTVGMDELNASHIIVYPNPSNGFFSIQSDAIFDAIYVQDGMGRVVYQSTAIASHKIDLSELQNGVYFMVVNVGNQQLMKRIEIIK